jgi:IS605 OrfB family transposase
LYKKDTENNQKPGFPRFKHEHYLPKATFLKTAIRIRDSKLLLSVGKKVKSEQNLKHIEIELPQEVYSFVSDKNVKMITLDKCEDGRYEIKLVYEKKLIPLKKNGDIMSIDLGVTNLAAITFMNSTDQILVDGNVIKSKIATFNRSIGILQSKQMKCVGSEDFVTTRKMKKLMCKRKGIVDYYTHTSSKRIVDIAESHDVKTIVIGDFKGIKSENKNKYFVQIPHTRLKDQIIYKARQRGIGVVLQEESYTSSVSAVDLEEVSEVYADKSRRVVRGLFKTSYGYINSDINGSLNILRKYVDYKNIPRLITSMRDKGLREDPIRLLIA